MATRPVNKQTSLEIGKTLELFFTQSSGKVTAVESRNGSLEP